MVTFDAETGEVIEAAPPREKVSGIHKIKSRLGKLRKDGDAARSPEEFSVLIKQHKDDLKTIRDANHEWWTGDGEDFEGYRDWIDRRRAELRHVDSATFQLLASCVAEAATKGDLYSILDEYAEKIGELDGEESRRFEAAYNEKEQSFAAPTPLEAGAFGG
jgi:hypothetical protein